ncbi:replication protein A 32 kDa subunit-B-like [Babylonia areolata]|uniref:replication protein A 32 kDa subunit-B-like n=1 Tax=Babylonia areolata TaxID=304850 RepID=UPI003FD6AAE0
MWSDQGGFNQDGGFEGQGGFSSPGGFGTPQPAEEKRGRSRAQNLVPVTVAQIFNASNTDDRFFSGNLEISQIAVIGLIRSVKESQTRVDYEIDDMTGPVLQVRHFSDQDENLPDDQREEPLRENTYVRVCGHVRSFQGKRNVVAFKVLPVVDMNELTCHMLEIIRAHAAANMVDNSVGGGNAMSTSAGAPRAGDYSGSTNFPGMSSLHSQIATIIKNNTTDVGASVADVSKHLRGVPEKAIREAVEFLSGEGHIYSTIDDDHFKATDG